MPFSREAIMDLCFWGFAAVAVLVSVFLTVRKMDKQALK
jgi:hypothetical protein